MSSKGLPQKQIPSSAVSAGAHLVQLECFQCAGATFLVLDDWAGVILAQADTAGGEFQIGHFPGAMNEFGGDFGKFREVGFDVGSIRVELLSLDDRIEDAEVGCGIGTTAADPLPAEGVVGEIRIDKGVPEPMGSFDPMSQEVFDKKRADDHADPVVHPTSLPQLTHAGIDNRIAGLSLLP